MPDNFVAFAAVVLIFGLPVIGILTSHQRRILEMKLRLRQGVDQNVTKELQDIRQQVADLRDTTTRYDLSFDAALQRLESRIGGIEQRVTGIEGDRHEARAGRS